MIASPPGTGLGHSSAWRRSPQSAGRRRRYSAGYIDRHLRGQREREDQPGVGHAVRGGAASVYRELLGLLSSVPCPLVATRGRGNIRDPSRGARDATRRVRGQPADLGRDYGDDRLPTVAVFAIGHDLLPAMWSNGPATDAGIDGSLVRPLATGDTLLVGFVADTTSFATRDDLVEWLLAQGFVACRGRGPTAGRCRTRSPASICGPPTRRSLSS